MDGKERSLVSLKEENDSYRIENDFLKNEFMKIFGMLPSIQTGGFTEEELIKFRSQFNRTREDTENMLKMQDELKEIKNQKEQVERQNMNLINENTILNAKLNNLETVFIGGNIIRNKDGSITNDIGENYNLTSVMLENKELKKAIDKLEIDKIELKGIISKTQNPGEQIRNERLGFEGLQEHNNKLARRVEFLQKRERELLETIMKLKMD